MRSKPSGLRPISHVGKPSHGVFGLAFYFLPVCPGQDLPVELDGQAVCFFNPTIGEKTSGNSRRGSPLVLYS
jgi:hypothetical protein